jgi:hypothetical protein
MKTKYILILALILALVGCQKDSPLPNFQDTIAKKSDFPVRPDLQPGENSGKLLLKSASIVADLTTLTPEELVGALIGTGPNTPTISNVSFTGAPSAAGTFTDLTNVFGFEKGIVLSTGDISYIQGPNTSDGTSQNNGLPGDADLNALIPGYLTNDATVLEFDFECDNLQVISFQYVFTSEEYNEYVGTAYNDVFGFFVNGVNIALIPETVIPVSINNLNCGNPYGSANNYCALFNNNDLSDGGGSYDTEMDGFTVILTATTAVNPGVNHIKLAIADAGDYILDSNVLIKGESFVCAPPILPVLIDIKPGSDPNSINCNNVNEVIAVAILTTDYFDALTVNHETVLFEGAAECHINKGTGLMERHEEDVDLDGDMDLVFHFKLGETNLDCLSIEGTLTGELFDGIPITGTDAVRMLNVPAKK